MFVGCLDGEMLFSVKDSLITHQNTSMQEEDEGLIHIQSIMLHQDHHNSKCNHVLGKRIQ